MIRKATFNDIELIEDTYNEHFQHEIEHKTFTVFKKGVYPARKDADKAITAGTLYVYEKDNNIAGSIIIDNVQPNEYKEIAWNQILTNDEGSSEHGRKWGCIFSYSICYRFGQKQFM